ncbi:FAD-dependent oxidoreductase [Sphingomonas adhaesiva]|uniref:FAD-dependent oxidoreductase n=1 Tax=Sphingomonas adhaesiva TaxID=28212 RepID=UPI002FFC317A
MATRDLADGIAATELTEGLIVAGQVDGTDIVLVRHRGRVCALSGQCTHLKAPLADGIVVDGTIRCPWHHARFDVESGEAVGAPAFAPLERFSVTEQDGHVHVATAHPVDDRVQEESAPAIGRVVIVGAGAAGHACAEMLARHGAGASVTLIGDEADEPYDRTFCSKQYLAGKAGREEMALPAPDGVTLRTGVTVAAITRDDRTVTLDDGTSLPYETLVLATGAEPVRPDFYGSNRDDVHVVRTVSDADRLIAASVQARRAIVVGSSYIGLEVAASLIGRGLEVAVVSDTDLPLEKTAGTEIGAMIRELHGAKGVTFHPGRRIAQWDGKVAMLDDGTHVEGDLVVAGVGVAPRLALAEAAGLALADKADGGGVAVDDRLRTSDPAIHAIGDIASAPDRRLGHPIRVEHWVVAQRMGQWLARHLLGQVSDGYDDVPFFWSGHYDLSLRYVGHVASPEDRTIDGDVAARDVAVHFAEDGREQALLTAGRDRLSLEREAEWERR